MTHQADPLTTSSAPTARLSSGADDAHPPADPAARDCQSATLLTIEFSSLAGAAPNPATVLRLIGLLFRAARHLLRTHRREAW